jgi:hypothetical protein
MRDKYDNGPPEGRRVLLHGWQCRGKLERKLAKNVCREFRTRVDGYYQAGILAASTLTDSAREEGTGDVTHLRIAVSVALIRSCRALALIQSHRNSKHDHLGFPKMPVYARINN